MKIWQRLAQAFFFLSFSTVLLAASSGPTPPTEWITKTPQGNVINIELYQSSTCPYCLKANVFLQTLAFTVPWIKLHVYSIDVNKSDLEHFSKRLFAQKSNNFSVPAIFFCGAHWVGFSNQAETGEELKRGLNYCYDRINRQGYLSDNTIRVLNSWAYANQFESGLEPQASPWLFITKMSLLDAVNPCTLFGLCMALGWYYFRERRGMPLILSCFFVTHYFIQVHSELYLENLLQIRIATVAVGLCLAAYLLWQLYTMRLHKTLKAAPRFIKSMLCLSLISIIFASQYCNNNLSHIFQQWLLHQPIAVSTYWLYLMSYQLIYLTGLWGMMLFLTIFDKIGLCQLNAGRKTLLGLCFLVTMAILLLFNPITLGSYVYSLILIPILWTVAALLSRMRVIKEQFNQSF